MESGNLSNYANVRVLVTGYSASGSLKGYRGVVLTTDEEGASFVAVWSE